MMVMTNTAMATAIKFLYCYNFDCFHEGLSFKKDGPFSLSPRCIFKADITALRHKSCPFMSNSG